MATETSVAEEGARVDNTALAIGISAEPVALSEANFYRRYGKRVLDLALGLPLLMLSLPLILLLAAAVMATGGLPAFYSATRVGKGGREFQMWKIRSMVRDADEALERWRKMHPEVDREYSENFKLRDDPRVTSLGRFLRRSSLDELPQLWNVVTGDMSLVGPRPYYISELEPYPDVFITVTSLRPGLTGPWQVRGRNAIPPLHRMRLDKHYAANLSVGSDLAYLASTIRPLLKADGL